MGRGAGREDGRQEEWEGGTKGEVICSEKGTGTEEGREGQKEGGGSETEMEEWRR